MRLFGLVDGLIDRRDRAAWVTPPFDRRFSSGIVGPFRVAAAEPHSLTAVQGQVVTAGPASGVATCP